MEDIVYLARVNNIADGENIEDLLNGNNPSTIGTDNSALFPSTVVRGVDTSKASSATEAIMWKKNAESTASTATYFFYGADLGQLRDNIVTLLNEPTSEDAIDRIECGKATAGDRIGDNKTTLIIMKIPVKSLNAQVDMGNAELRVGKYGTDNISEIDEVAVSDAFMKKFCKKDNVFAYDTLAKTINNPALWGYDVAPYDLSTNMVSNYKPSYTFDVTRPTTSGEKQHDEKQHDEAHAFLAKLIESGASEEDIAMYKSALEDLDKANFDKADTTDGFDKDM